uniref:Uncharacterized protein n=1 Tax=Candidatus Kentrum sp. LPFa TaxID=2126335 RepID=A0A450XT76_9GAMM|nr:MAG: hypothetical protein BECKLPF1236A_GA0070988_101522 [Candidatus Kentron sp. LPFa]VFK32475.1 MAG: hypothetical protein BECKLPF1236C_GA0070990_101679 [Candidatus Kentron sp. LPFa]
MKREGKIMKESLHRTCCVLEYWFRKLKTEIKSPAIAIGLFLAVLSILVGGYVGLLVVLFLVALLLIGFFALPYLLRVTHPIQPEPDEQSELAFSYIENKFACCQWLREQEAIDALVDKGIDDERAEEIQYFLI